MQKLLQRHHLVFLALFLAALLLRGWGVREQPPLDAEAAAVSSAYNYLESGMLGRVMWYHPPLRNIVIFLSGELFGGYSSWGLRFGSILFGSLSIPLLGYLGRSLFRSTGAGALAALFLCLDPLHISLSREAFQETTTAFFIIAGTLAALRAIRSGAPAFAYLSGILFGLASSSKWHGLFPWAVSAACFLGVPWFLKGQRTARPFAERFLITLAAYVAVPLAVYVSIHIPWLFRGNSLVEFSQYQLWLVQHQYLYTGTPYTEEILSHRAWMWFLWPVAWVDFVFHQGREYLNIAYGNFLVWVLTLPSLSMLVKSWLKDKTVEMGYVIVLFLASYLPLVLTTRSIWVFAAPAIIPFAFLMSARVVTSLVEAGKVSRMQLTGFLAAVVLLTAALYPMATFKALQYPIYRPLAEMYAPHSYTIK